MRTKMYIFLMIACLNAFKSLSQNSSLGNWYIYLGNKKLKDQWNWHNELQYRNYNIIGDLEQLLIRTGIGYNISPNNNNVLLGYAFINSQNYQPDGEDKISFNEHRVFQQFITNQSFSRLNLIHRYRFEQRWIENQNFKVRFRYFLSFNLALNHKYFIDKTLYLSAYNEIFINGSSNYFDRNRLYAGLGFKLNKIARFELGYMNQILNATSRDQINIISFLNF